MPKYFFNLCSDTGIIIGDGMGRDFENDASARRFARSGAEFIILGPGLANPHLAHHRLEVATDGRCIYRLPLSKLTGLA